MKYTDLQSALKRNDDNLHKPIALLINENNEYSVMTSVSGEFKINGVNIKVFSFNTPDELDLFYRKIKRLIKLKKIINVDNVLGETT